MPSGVYKRTKKHRDIISRGQQGKKMPKKTRRKISEALKGKKRLPFTEKHKLNLSKSHIGKHRGKNNLMWRGDDVGYIAVHEWINTHKGKPQVCESCRATRKEKKLAWANKDHSYKRIFEDYIALCYRCHCQYDKYNNGTVRGRFRKE